MNNKILIKKKNTNMKQVMCVFVSDKRILFYIKKTTKNKQFLSENVNECEFNELFKCEKFDEF